ncbi:phosphoribosylanthranilate isomerase [Halalkalibacter urbisdiaboli]|uniref:phosphoribosylanthranilate isomerase n=1 Tax=Halalkalibacter urbisdiaboli TaxID=1960589 RepID=UPI000B44743C|nr:phosphoribosylanthranilate isomerase [Halalkalibacter urbisdiaboli]
MRPLLKICGNHSKHDVHVALASGADYIGFVFAESKRKVTNNDLRNWLQGERNGKKVVALFVNADADMISSSIKGVPVDIIQCHGAESVELVQDVKRKIALPVWKVIHHHEQALETMRSFTGVADGYIIDCKADGKWGGTGKSFDWSHVPAYVEEGRHQQVPVFIAGGVSPDNVEQLLAYQPDGIDLSSGIEQDGFKSASLVNELEERMNNCGSKLS